MSSQNSIYQKDNTKWIDVSGRDDPPKEKVETDLPKIQLAPFSLGKLDVVKVAISYLKGVLVLGITFTLGYFGFSPAWLLLASILWVARERWRIGKESRQSVARIHSAPTEKKEIAARLGDLPSWVFFPDVEKAEWLNKIILQLWPFINRYVKTLIKEQIEPKVREVVPGIVKSFYFETIDVGDTPCRIGGIKVYQDRLNRDEIIIDMEVFYAGDCEFTLNLNGIKSGVKDVQLHGMIRAHVKPLIPDIPFVGALKVFFLNTPAIDFNLTSLANALDVPGLSDLIRKISQDILASMLVLPNKFGIILSKDIDAKAIKFCVPHGVVRITVFSAHNLISADIKLIGKGKSDPYAKIYVGSQEFKTTIIDNNLNPVWNEVFEAIVDEPYGQRLEVTLLDHDPNKDDFLGRVELDIDSVMKNGTIDSTFELEDTKHGDIHLRLDWLNPVVAGPEILGEELEMIKEMQNMVQGSLSTAILVVFVDSAKALPFPKNSASEPSPYAVITCGAQKFKTEAIPKTQNPVWEKNFTILVNNPEVSTINIEVLDEKSNKRLGVMDYQIAKMFSEPNYEKNDIFPLVLMGNHDARISLSFALRLLKSGPDINVAKAAERSKAQADQDAVDYDELKKYPGDPASASGGLTRLTPAGTKKEDDYYYDKEGARTQIKESAKGSKPPGKEEGGVKVIAASPTGKPPPVHTNDPGTAREIKSMGDPATPTPSRPPQPYLKNIGQTNSMNRQSLPMIYQEGLKQRKSSKCPRVLLNFYHDDAHNKLIVLLERVENINTTGETTADPYVKLELLPHRGKESTKRKSITIKNSVNPTFNEKFDWTCPADELPYRKLVVTVKNEGTLLKSNITLGYVEVNLGQVEYNEERGIWFNLSHHRMACFNWIKHMMHHHPSKLANAS